MVAEKTSGGLITAPGKKADPSKCNDYCHLSLIFGVLTYPHMAIPLTYISWVLMWRNILLAQTSINQANYPLGAIPMASIKYSVSVDSLRHLQRRLDCQVPRQLSFPYANIKNV